MAMGKSKRLPSQDELQRLFEYSVITGELRWKVRPAWQVRVGDVAGTVNGHGYTAVCIGGIIYAAHRLIWKLVTGEDPTECIDHVDRDGSNNAWMNLREATRRQNQCNRGVQANNTSGFKGVSWVARRKEYSAQIKIDGKTTFLGHFKTAEEAHRAYREAATRLHGEFARFD
jgi:hypothetical protein